ncbi:MULTISPECIES: PDR/VanB family oxidoreductase [unclassified Bradyrhizobium]|uniref:PDR/VanB family oxidoreductase n=1 Tax=unclassified Bradyrhizobium TaxID=2631580 RepID=UPI00247A6615|nr:MULTISPECIES: PDR/VanB family oxidoreductase [unclassified Bradyrhizobium]WGR73145.1 PDR/VanB family oxidoreductase [Bradyrhizobium sp. ISRA426]WGR77985.1 PDR/VanB family oxidoreductase [Bradyrhizobium sp. ISRA430]WGR88386.1 PDR/VanB family oxidoreductase [Bradyrhizobium sp. ISRA432]
MTVAANPIETVIAEVRPEATDILSFELRPRAGTILPPFTAGAHVEVYLPDLQIRSYSLLNDQNERDRYVIAVRRDANGRGGSRYMHDRLGKGDALTISAPRNHFPLVEDAHHTVFIVGGIGVTPILSMVRRLEQIGRSWEMHFGARSPAHAAFYDYLRAFNSTTSSRVRFYFDGGVRDDMLDVGSLIAPLPSDTHLYCCGPLGMMDVFRGATAARPAKTVHFEYFAGAAVGEPSGGFDVELAQSGKTLTVRPGKTILEAMIEAGLDAPYSCREGVCGSCETRVLAGIPDHRDLVLTASERARGETMMICCSGSLSSKLVIDL